MKEFDKALDINLNEIKKSIKTLSSKSIIKRRNEMKIFNKQIGLIKSGIKKTKIESLSFDYDEEFASIFIHYAKSKPKHLDYENHKDALHDFLILIKKIKIKKQ